MTCSPSTMAAGDISRKSGTRSTPSVPQSAAPSATSRTPVPRPTPPKEPACPCRTIRASIYAGSNLRVVARTSSRNIAAVGPGYEAPYFSRMASLTFPMVRASVSGTARAGTRSSFTRSVTSGLAEASRYQRPFPPRTERTKAPPSTTTAQMMVSCPGEDASRRGLTRPSPTPPARGGHGGPPVHDDGPDDGLVPWGGRVPAGPYADLLDPVERVQDFRIQA